MDQFSGWYNKLFGCKNRLANMEEKTVRSPVISVVMGVKNAESTIKKTVDSILNQEDESLELIIVNDGSTDGTDELLKELSRKDNRIRFLSRENKGLTVSLIEGCAVAEGEFLARHDANDLSLPGRLRAQANALRENINASFCSTYVRHVTKEGIGALITGQNGIIHGSVMMRRSAYQKVGGYRRQFYYAQDVDLWSRLREVGSHIEVPFIYYEALLFPESISGTKGQEQKRFFELIEQASFARRDNREEKVWLDKAEELSMRCRGSRVRTTSFADGAYFIGSCLIEHNPSLAREYFKDAIRFNKLHLKSHLKLMGM